MNAYTIFKTGTGLAIGAGVSKIAKTIIDNHVVPQTTAEKILCGLGRFGIAMTASAVVAKHVEAQMDEYNVAYHKVKDKYQEELAKQK